MSRLLTALVQAFSRAGPRVEAPATLPGQSLARGSAPEGPWPGPYPSKGRPVRRARAFTFIICIDDTKTSSAWLVEDRLHPAGSDGHRSSRLLVDLNLADLRGCSAHQIAWRLAHGITDAQEKSDAYGFFS